MCLMKRLWEFQNGKMGVYRQKINQDTVKKCKNLNFEENNSFCSLAKKNYTPILLHSVFNTYDYAYMHTYA